MSKKESQGITVNRSDDIAQWYEQVVLKSEIAEFGDVKGTIILRPKGYYMWEQVQKYFADEILNRHEVENTYFPMFIPESFFTKEAEHAEGFAPELAWVSAVNMDGDSEKAILRPTSETSIMSAFSRWLRNYRQLPMKVNQWANVVRWEVKQTKLFLRGREFLWQEGHCLYETDAQCQADVESIIHAYADLCKRLLAIPVIVGQKTELEKFPGAIKTYTIEGVMPDGKALQMGTSHNLGQGFSKAFGVSFQGADEHAHFPFYNSWGVSTRLLGATIMTHSDDKGLVLPPLLVKRKVVIIPMTHKNNALEIMAACEELASQLGAYGAYVDKRDQSMGWKLNDAELMGVPFVCILGGRELEEGVITFKPRDSEKRIVEITGLAALLDEEVLLMQSRLFDSALSAFNARIKTAKTESEFASLLESGHIVRVPFSGSREIEERILAEYGVSSRCIDMVETVAEDTVCAFGGGAATQYVYFGKAY